jgi:hypothetical protein
MVLPTRMSGPSLYPEMMFMSRFFHIRRRRSGKWHRQMERLELVGPRSGVSYQAERGYVKASRWRALMFMPEASLTRRAERRRIVSPNGTARAGRRWEWGWDDRLQRYRWHRGIGHRGLCRRLLLCERESDSGVRQMERDRLVDVGVNFGA